MITYRVRGHVLEGELSMRRTVHGVIFPSRHNTVIIAISKVEVIGKSREQGGVWMLREETRLLARILAF